MTLAFLLQAAPPAGPLQGLAGFLPIIIVFVIFYFVLLAPMRKQQKKTKEMLASIKKGDRVLTTGGIYGTIAKVEEQRIWVWITDSVKVEMARSAVSGLVERGEAPKDPAA